jgi:hypothetical protein
MKKWIVFGLTLIGRVLSYGVPPPPPPPCNTPQCASGTYCFSNTNLCTPCPQGYMYNANPNVGVSSANLWGCTICPPGTFASSSGSSRCSSCPVGTFAASSGSSGCIPCPTGTFTSAQGQSGCASCATCVPGQYVYSACNLQSNTVCLGCTAIANCAVTPACSTASNSQCSACSSGYFLQSNSCVACTTCNSGIQYETTACTSLTNRQCATCVNTCPVGSALAGFCNGPTNNYCSPCAIGTYKSVADGSPCLPCTTMCSAGFHLIATCLANLNSFCVACPSGTYKSLSDGSACLPCTSICPAGYQLNQACSSTVNPICVACPSGTYKSLSDGSACLPCTSVCAAGYQLNQACSSAVNPICIACPSGTYKSLLDGSVCLPCTSVCAAGYQLNQACTTTVNPICIACPSGTYKYLTDGSPCLACHNNCGPGSYLNSLCNAINNPTCLKCPINTANPNDFSVFITACDTCPNGAVSVAGSATCVQCPLGSATFGNVNCTDCLPGTYSDNIGSITCKLCPAGTANSNTGSTNLTTCLLCLPGYTSLKGSSSCSPCPIGTYENGLRECISCQVGTYNELTGQTVCALCPAGTANIHLNSVTSLACLNCLPGTFSSVGAESCMQCAPGSFTNISGSPNCTLAQPGTFVAGNGSTTVQKCAPGSYSEVSGLNSCAACAPGSYNLNEGSANATACLSCPFGTFTNRSGSPICINTSVGFYQDTFGQTAGRPCPPGTFNAMTGSVHADACVPCLRGKYQPKNGSENCLQCPMGTYQNIRGQLNCIRCPAGTYNALLEATAVEFCLHCPSGTYSPTIGANSSATCVSTPLGTYTNLSGASNYTECSPGFYQNTVQQINCMACSPGTFNSLAAATNSSFCLPAPPGFFVFSTGSYTPSMCPPGSWINNSGATACMMCLPGTFTAKSGSTSCLPCPQGTFTLGSGFTQCEPLGLPLVAFDVTSDSIAISITTNFTATVLMRYTCSQICTFAINGRSLAVQTHDGLLALDMRLGVDQLTVEYTGDFTSSLNVKWTCTVLANSLTRCHTIPDNIVITSLTLITERSIPNPYADPAIDFTSSLGLSNPAGQTYAFFLTGLESAVNYKFTVVINVINETFLLPPFNLGSRETLESHPTGPVQNLVKHFLGIDIPAQANLEQTNLQVHWEPPVTILQHGAIIGYYVDYIQESRTYITYGPIVETHVTPAVSFSITTNETTLILNKLVPDTVYTITVYPFTKAPGKGPGNTIVLNTRVSAPPKPPVLTLLNRAETNITVSWSNLTNASGLITKVWIVAEPYDYVREPLLNTSQVVIIPLNNADIRPLPFPHEGVQGIFQSYNISNACQDEIVGYTFRSLTTKTVCGGICDTLCEFGTPMLDPTTILPTNDQNLTNDNFKMHFNSSTGNSSSRLVPYLTMKRRFAINSTAGGLLGFGKIVIGDGKINPNSLLNNTKLLPHLSYRIRFIVFTSEVLYAVSDPLEIPPFAYPEPVNSLQSMYFGLLIALILIVLACILLCFLKYCLKRRADEQQIEIDNAFLEKKIISYMPNIVPNIVPDAAIEYTETDGPMLPPKESGLYKSSVTNPMYWTTIYKPLDRTNKPVYDTVDIPNLDTSAYFDPNSDSNRYFEVMPLSVPSRNFTEAKYMDVSLPNTINE